MELLCWQVTNLWGDADISVKDMILEAWNQTFDNMIDMWFNLFLDVNVTYAQKGCATTPPFYINDQKGSSRKLWGTFETTPSQTKQTLGLGTFDGTRWRRG